MQSNSREHRDHPVEHLVRNAKKYNSTEELLFFIAAEDGMLDLCRQLVGKEDAERTQALKQACRRHNVVHTQLLANIHEVVRSLATTDSDILHAYATLGLAESATREQVKKAFRRLSLQYHPDQSGAKETTETFHAIQKAYTAITEQDAQTGRQQAKQWVRSASTSRRKKTVAKKRFIYGVLGLVFFLIVASIFLDNQNQTRALKQRLTSAAASSKAEETAQGSPTEPRSDAKESKQKQQPDAPDTQIPPDPSLSNTHDDMTMLEMESVIPPDPEVLAALKKPFPRQIEATAPKKNKPPTPPPPQENSSSRQQADKLQQTEEKTTDINTAEQTQTVASVKDTAPSPQPSQAVQSKQAQQLAVQQQAVQQQALQQQTEQRQQPLQRKEPKKVAKQQEPSATPQKNPLLETPRDSVKVKEFLASFTRTYTGRDVTQHMAHFLPGATENGKAISTLKPTYRDLFGETDHIAMKIINIQWNKTANGFKIEGEFSARYSYMAGGDKEYIGDVTFVVVQRKNAELKIGKFEYEFKETH